MKVEIHKPGVVTIDHLMSAMFCRAQIERGEQLGFVPAEVRIHSGPRLMARVRNNERCTVDDHELATILWSRVAPHLNTFDLDATPVAVDQRFRIYKYLPGQRFLGHRDGRETVGALSSRLSFLLYLNDDCEGGETVFRDRRRRRPEISRGRTEIRIEPKMGRALLFEHHHWHEGSRVLRGIKYVLRSDILYR